MSLNTFPDLIFKASNMPRITCMTCGDVMPLDHREAISAHFEIRGYVCPECDIVETFVIDLGLLEAEND